MKNNNKEYITIHRNHIVPYYPTEKHINLELQNYLLTNEIPILKQPTIQTSYKKEIEQDNIQKTHSYNLRKKKILLA